MKEKLFELKLKNGIIPEGFKKSIDIIDDIKYRKAINLFNSDLKIFKSESQGRCILTQKEIEVEELSYIDRHNKKDLQHFFNSELIGTEHLLNPKILNIFKNTLIEKIKMIAWEDLYSILSETTSWIEIIKKSSIKCEKVNDIVEMIYNMIIKAEEMGLNDLYVYVGSLTYKSFKLKCELDNIDFDRMNLNFNFDIQPTLTNHIIITEKNNLVYGTDINWEKNKITCWDLGEYIEFEAKWKQGSQIKWPERIITNF